MKKLVFGALLLGLAACSSEAPKSQRSVVMNKLEEPEAKPLHVGESPVIVFENHKLLQKVGEIVPETIEDYEEIFEKYPHDTLSIKEIKNAVVSTLDNGENRQAIAVSTPGNISFDLAELTTVDDVKGLVHHELGHTRKPKDSLKIDTIVFPGSPRQSLYAIHGLTMLFVDENGEKSHWDKIEEGAVEALATCQALAENGSYKSMDPYYEKLAWFTVKCVDAGYFTYKDLDLAIRTNGLLKLMQKMFANSELKNIHLGLIASYFGRAWSAESEEDIDKLVSEIEEKRQEFNK